MTQGESATGTGTKVRRDVLCHRQLRWWGLDTKKSSDARVLGVFTCFLF